MINCYTSSFSSSLETVCIVTGANSGLGFAIACRFIDEFLSPDADAKLPRPSSTASFAPSSSDGYLRRLTLVISTRTEAKAVSTIALLKRYVAKRHSASNTLQLKLDYILLDLCSLYSVSRAATELTLRYDHITHFFCNAGMGDFIGIDWLLCAKDILLKNVHALTYPRFKRQGIGRLTTAHESVLVSPISGKTANESKGEDMKQNEELGAVFCANVFGHYYLLHECMKLLRVPKSSGRDRTRIIWISSLESYGHSFSIDDFQGISSPISYESSKRLTDILVMSCEDPDTSFDVRTFMTPPGTTLNETDDSSSPPLFLLCHPGIVATAIVPLPLILVWAMTLAFYMCRWAGSVWHCVTSYTGAVAPVWAALSEDVAQLKGKKWGSTCDRRGRAVVRVTEVDDGWQELGGPLWHQLEALRIRWRAVIDN